MRKQIYLAIVEKLKTIVNTSGTTAILHFDLWNQNVDFAQEEAFPTPAVFIEFSPIKYKLSKEAAQVADVPLRLHIVTEATLNTYSGAFTQEEGLNFFDLIDQVNKKMYELAGQGRIASYTNHDHGTLMESIEEYTLVGEVDRSCV